MGGKPVEAVGTLAEVVDEGLLFRGGAETPDAMRDITGNIARQQGMIEVQHDRQQLKYLLPVATHEAQRPLRLETGNPVITRNQRVEFFQQCPAYHQGENDAPKAGYVKKV